MAGMSANNNRIVKYWKKEATEKEVWGNIKMSLSLLAGLQA